MDAAHVIAPGGTGGAESVVQTLARVQRDRGREVGVIALVEPGSSESRSFRDLLRDRGIPLRTLEVPHRSYWREWTRLREVLAGLEPELVHTHGYHADVIGGLAAGSKSLRRVSTVHGFTGGGWRNRLYEKIQKFMLRYFEAVVAVSATVAQDLLSAGVPAERVTVVTNSWEPAEEQLSRSVARDVLGLDPYDFVVGWVGRLTSEKAPALALRAVARLRRDVVLSMIGDGPQSPVLEELIVDLGLTDDVRLHGMIPDAQRVFPAFDVFVLSSRTEGTPMVLLEAAHARVPIVASRVGGVSDLLDPDAAWLVPPESPGALADAIRYVIAHRDEAERRARKARRHVERKHSLDRWFDSYEEVYGSVLADVDGGVSKR